MRRITKNFSISLATLLIASAVLSSVPVKAAVAVADVNTLVYTAERTNAEGDVSAAYTATAGLPDGAVKANLQAALGKIFVTVYKAPRAVAQAEKTLAAADIQNAYAIVSALPAGKEKRVLNARVLAAFEVLKNSSLAENSKKIIKAETTGAAEDIQAAYVAAATLPYGADEAIYDLYATNIKAPSLVGQAEKTLAGADIKAAYVEVDALTLSVSEGSLRVRVLNAYNKSKGIVPPAPTVTLQQATDAVVKAEGSKLQADKDAATTLVAGLADGADKTALQQRIEAIKVAPVDNVSVTSTTVKDAAFGSTVTVTSNYKGAANYQVYAGSKAVSAVTALGTATTVYPKKATGDAITIKLLDANKAELVSLDGTLGTDITKAQPEGTVTPPITGTSDVTGTIKDAAFGSLVTISSAFTGAVSYQVFDGTKAISAITTLGTSTTVYPKKAAGDKVVIKLIDTNSKIINTVDLTF